MYNISWVFLKHLSFAKRILYIALVMLLNITLLTLPIYSTIVTLEWHLGRDTKTLDNNNAYYEKIDETLVAKPNYEQPGFLPISNFITAFVSDSKYIPTLVGERNMLVKNEDIKSDSKAWIDYNTAKELNSWTGDTLWVPFYIQQDDYEPIQQLNMEVKVEGILKPYNNMYTAKSGLIVIETSTVESFLQTNNIFINDGNVGLGKKLLISDIPENYLNIINISLSHFIKKENKTSDNVLLIIKILAILISLTFSFLLLKKEDTQLYNSVTNPITIFQMLGVQQKQIQQSLIIVKSFIFFSSLLLSLFITKYFIFGFIFEMYFSTTMFWVNLFVQSILVFLVLYSSSINNTSEIGAFL